MAVITRSVPRTSQPIGPVGVDPALGWQAAWVGGRDVLNVGAALAGTTRTVTRGGHAAVRGPMPGTVNLALEVPVGYSWTLLMQMTPLDISTNYPYFLGISGAATAVALTAKHSSVGGAMLWYDGSGIRDSGVFLSQGVQSTVGLTYNGATREYCWYKDGAAAKKQIGQLTGGGQWQWASLYDNLNSIAHSLFAIANKAIPAEKMRQLTANPWSAFEPERRRAYFTAPSAPLSSFWANVGGTPTRSLGLRAWNGSAVVTPVARIWNGTTWESVQ